MNTEGGMTSLGKGVQLRQNLPNAEGTRKVSGRWDRRPQSAAEARFGKTHVGTFCFEGLLARQDETGVDGVYLGTVDECMIQ